jgi:RNA-directed DNA polymerase
LLHHLSVDQPRAAYRAINPEGGARGGPGEVGIPRAGLEANLQDLDQRVRAGRDRALPARRVDIPKADGRQRPLGIATLEDKLVQRAVVEVLNAIEEADLRGFSCGFGAGAQPA